MMFHIFIILLLSDNGDKVDGNSELRSRQQLKRCLKHNQLDPIRIIFCHLSNYLLAIIYKINDQSAKYINLEKNLII